MLHALSHHVKGVPFNWIIMSILKLWRFLRKFFKWELFNFDILKT